MHRSAIPRTFIPWSRNLLAPPRKAFPSSLYRASVDSRPNPASVRVLRPALLIAERLARILARWPSALSWLSQLLDQRVGRRQTTLGHSCRNQCDASTA